VIAMKRKKAPSHHETKIDWRHARKSKRRQFKLTIEVPHYFPLVEEVLDSIEQDTLYVFQPDDESAFACAVDEDNIEVLNKRATLPVSIREWLCVGCQLIEMKCCPHEDVLATYNSNLFESILAYEDTPLGPACFWGKIGLCKGRIWKDYDDVEHDAFRFTVAHELIHVFDTLRLIVPAFMDWKTFWRKALHDGESCDLAWNMFNATAGFVDRYETELEKASVAEYWPSKVEEWFRARVRVAEEHRRLNARD
jgi:hypothetical protein